MSCVHTFYNDFFFNPLINLPITKYFRKNPLKKSLHVNTNGWRNTFYNWWNQNNNQKKKK